eukprot:CAMPEP_0117443486 /NCGR_PEP_ID=MMETSP0759-20121206/4718_1 /TAXON_ID=63605 /ORGANISM="Percolomonas cosmopolitus, Strain WS" /LENGTH=509 /DNA_ID=CAMNT_0005235459 /DNA_START=163 /DNA_END=1692 /DNA_ORIENTATION=+
MPPTPPRKSHTLGKRKRQDAASLFGYTDQNNPFNDPKLTTPFNEWDSVDNAPQVDELQSLKKRRIQRQIEQKHLIEMRLAREREELARLWGDSDDHFEWKQIILKSEIRINEKRAKLIDYLIDHSKLLHPPTNHNDHNPSTPPCTTTTTTPLPNPDHHSATQDHSNPSVMLSDAPPQPPKLDALSKEDLVEFINDLEHCLSIEHLPFKELWESLHTLANHQLSTLNNTNHTHFTHQLIQHQIDELFNGKDYDQLLKTEEEIREQLQDPEADVEYWDSLLRHMHIYKAQALLNHFYTDMMTQWNLQQAQRREQERKKKLETDESQQTQDAQPNTPAASNAKLTPQDLIMKQSDQGSTVAFSNEVSLPVNSAASSEQPHESAQPTRKHRLVKPQYYNRVILGFEWSKYNRIHFDIDNLPPKQIQGYRFNLFFPLLPEGAPSPTYTVEKHSKGFCIVRFHAGHPYSDIAFQIIDKGDWETKPRKGFRCEFHSGILSLWFKFKRHTRRRKKGR